MSIKTENLQVTNSATLPAVTSVSKTYGAKDAINIFNNANILPAYAWVDTSSLNGVNIPCLQKIAPPAEELVISVDITDFVKSGTKGRKITEINVIFDIQDVNLTAHSIILSAGTYTNAGGISGTVIIPDTALTTTKNATGKVYKSNIAVSSPAITNYDQYIAEIYANLPTGSIYEFIGLQVIAEENFY